MYLIALQWNTFVTSQASWINYPCVMCWSTTNSHLSGHVNTTTKMTLFVLKHRDKQKKIFCKRLDGCIWIVCSTRRHTIASYCSHQCEALTSISFQLNPSIMFSDTPWHNQSMFSLCATGIMSFWSNHVSIKKKGVRTGKGIHYCIILQRDAQHTTSEFYSWW